MAGYLEGEIQAERTAENLAVTWATIASLAAARNQALRAHSISSRTSEVIFLNGGQFRFELLSDGA